MTSSTFFTFALPGAFTFSLIAAACGGTVATAPPREPASVDATRADVDSYAQLAASVSGRANEYRDAIMSASMTMMQCRSVHDAYDADVRPWLDHMAQMSDAMDKLMDDHGGATAADTSCVAAAMMGELDHHRAVACSAADLSTNQAEVTRHVGAMLLDTDHMASRCNQAMTGLDDGTWQWGQMMDGCSDWDGCCASMMSDCCGGIGMMGGGDDRACCGS